MSAKSLDFYKEHYDLMCSSLLSALVLKRKMPTAELPYAMFIIAHANSWFQIAVPCPQRDAHVHGKEITFPLFPPRFPKARRIERP